MPDGWDSCRYPSKKIVQRLLAFIIFEDMIHYTMVKTNMFNGIHHPSVALLHTDGELEVYKTFRYEDYRDRMC